MVKKRYGKNKRYRKRRAYRRGRINNSFSNPRSSVVGHNFGYPLGNRKLVRHKYSELITLNPGIGSMATYTFILNSLYDPNYSSTGHQPLGFDQMTAFFSHYTVVGTSITATFLSSDTNDIFCAIVHDSNITYDYSTTPSIGMSHIIEAKKGPYAFMSSNNDKQRLKLNWSLRKNEGITKPAQAIDWTGDALNGPPQYACAHVVVGPADGATDIGSVNILVQMDFIALWHDPIALTQS